MLIAQRLLINYLNLKKLLTLEILIGIIYLQDTGKVNKTNTDTYNGLCVSCVGKVHFSRTGEMLL